MENKMKKGNKILKFLNNLLFPYNMKCIFCNKEIFRDSERGLCEDCKHNLPFTGIKTCEKCGQTIHDMGRLCLSCKKSANKPYIKAFAPFQFDGKVIEVIHKLKYHNAKWLAEYLGRFILEEFYRQDIKIDVVVPIPLSEKRYKERGYNQAEIICCKFLESGFTVDNKNFIRTKHTNSQTNLTKVKRKENLKDAFTVVDKSAFKDKTILLVDDVFTTGATMEEASKVLLKAKAKGIYCLTIANVASPLQKKKQE